MSLSAGPNEKNTCSDYVVPRLRASGWSDDMIRTEVPVVAARSISSRRTSRVSSDGRADYVLEAFPGLPVAVVEAKRLYSAPSKGLQQGIEYAVRLDVPLVYATNGEGIRERDLASGTERDLDDFPTPAEVWLVTSRSTGWTQISRACCSSPRTGCSWPLTVRRPRPARTS